MTRSQNLAPEGDWVQEGWTHLSGLVDTDLPGWSRVGFSEQDVAGRDWVAQQMRQAGLTTRVDAVGNVIGMLEGTNPSAPAIVVGSHSDTVPGGGRFDGIVGVLGAIEVARTLRRAGIRPTHSLMVVDFANEEGNPQGVKLVGSRAAAGTLSATELAAADSEGTTLADLITGAGHQPDAVAGCRWKAADLAAYVELHIEQGPVMEEQGAEIGVVTRVCGISTFVLDIEGRRDHAGTTSMTKRSDPLCCAADGILAVQRIAAAGGDSVGTVGELTSASPLTNVIPETARLTGEFRSPELAGLKQLQAEFDAEAKVADSRHRTRSTVTWGHTDAPAIMDEQLSALAVRAASAAGHEAFRLYSGATHDSVEMAALAPSTMIFVPSRDGRSHCPEEWTDLADIERGIEVLTRTVLEADAAL